MAWLLPLIAGNAKLKVQIFTVDKDTQDLIGEFLLGCKDWPSRTFVGW